MQCCYSVYFPLIIPNKEIQIRRVSNFIQVQIVGFSTAIKLGSYQIVYYESRKTRRKQLGRKY